MNHEGSEAAVHPDPWSNQTSTLSLGGVAYGGFLEAFRDLQDAVSAANPPQSEWKRLESDIRALTQALEPWAAPEHSQPAGTRFDLPGRGHPFLIPYVPSLNADDSVEGNVTFHRLHLGGNGAAHGGSLPLLFDEVLGHLSNAGGRPVARTAFITVNYRQITPIDVELHFDATLDRIEGRKRWLSGRLRNGQVIVADAEGLFVELREGQP